MNDMEVLELVLGLVASIASVAWALTTFVFIFDRPRENDGQRGFVLGALSSLLLAGLIAAAIVVSNNA